MSSLWGRIADDGTVYVRTADGEREIGSWQAGDAQAGVAFYTRRFDDLATEVTLLEKRLESGAGDPGSTRAHAVELRGRLASAAAMGDIAALDSRLSVLVTTADERLGAQAAAREHARADAIGAKEALAAEAEKIAESATSWKASGDRLRVIVDEWKTIKGIDRKTDEVLWKRFAAARDAFGKRRGQHFAALDAERGSAKDAKEKLAARAEELSTSSDWRDTAAAMRELMSEWKAAPRASREVENALWTRFRSAQDTFFARRADVHNERDAEQVANQRAKESVLTEAEALDLSNARAAQTGMRGLQARYDEIGHVPRDAMHRLDERMRAAEQRIRDAVDADWRRTSADTNPFLAQLRDRLAEAEQKLDRARQAGDEERIHRAEADVAARRRLIPD